MALRAGYYGVKKNVLATIAAMAGAKIIKTIGDGLKLTSAGKLSCDIDTDTMTFKSGKLSAKGGTWSMVGESPTTGTVAIAIPANANEIMIVATYNTGSFVVGATMVVNVDALSSDVIYFDFGAGSSDAFFLRYGITDDEILLNTAKSNTQNVAASTQTRLYYR